MSAGQLDFAPLAFWRRWTPWTWAALVLAALALAALLAQALPAWQRAQQRDALAAQLARVNAQARARPPAAPPLPAALEADALASAQELAMPWGRLLGHLARQGDDKLALTQLEPDARAGSLLVSGQAASPEAALAYARRLGQGGTLSQVQLMAHEPVAVPQRLATQFRLSARWAPGGPVVDPVPDPAPSAASQPLAAAPASEVRR
ncbi:Fimbrial assembly protein (PilN) [Burkholderiales bacterium JOSHI_001]|nr:Fimbrial assembly protein (PilN) [Burkholderiales bacterium JOSHI_001]